MRINEGFFNEDYYMEKFAQRLTQLREARGISARALSLALGQSKSYINQIESKKNFPKMMGFFSICEYLKISPRDFFESDIKTAPDGTNLTPDDLEYLKLYKQASKMKRMKIKAYMDGLLDQVH